MRCSILLTLHKKNLLFHQKNHSLHVTVFLFRNTNLCLLQKWNILAESRRKREKKISRDQKISGARSDNVLKAFALTLVCTTMRLLTRTQTLLFSFIKVMLCCIFIWKKVKLTFSCFLWNSQTKRTPFGRDEDFTSISCISDLYCPLVLLPSVKNFTQDSTMLKFERKQSSI